MQIYVNFTNNVKLQSLGTVVAYHTPLSAFSLWTVKLKGKNITQC